VERINIRPPTENALHRTQSHASSLNVEALQNQSRDVQRAAILKYLNRDTYLGGSENRTRILNYPEQATSLAAIADEFQASGVLVFNRFERLCILDILQWQHRIVAIDEQIQFGNEKQKLDNTEELHGAIQQYGKRRHTNNFSSCVQLTCSGI